eukprot:SM000092S24469  [mRNA]  locus=s92:56715:59742:+ [translate_table: standard]
MPVCEALAHAEQQPSAFRPIHLKYSDEVGPPPAPARRAAALLWPGRRLCSLPARALQAPLEWDIVLAFPKQGFQLRFEPRSQRLRLVEVYDIPRLQLRYAASTIGGPSTPATFVRIYAVFGPTFPGVYDSKRGSYTLFYPGLSFMFPIPAPWADCCPSQDGDWGAELPHEFPDGTTPVTARVCISATVGPRPGPALPPPLSGTSCYMEEVQVTLAEGLRFQVGGQFLGFGASPQDVWAELGRPCAIQAKQVDTMVIHSASEERPQTALCGDYLYHYRTRGLDIVFHGQTHRIKKFVLHANQPGHPDFNLYIRCNFVIVCPTDSANANNSRHITIDTTWSEVQQLLGDAGRAVIQTSGSLSNPFGPSYVYGYCNVAFEVLKNGHLATVTLF